MRKNRNVRRILIYDASEKGFLGGSWGMGAKVFGHMFDHVYPCYTVDDAVNALQHVAETHTSPVVDARRLEAHWWGHGASGAPLIGGRNIMASEIPEAFDVIWFRTCYVAKGERGIAFMQTLSERGIDAVAHTGIIGTWGMHSGLVGVKAGERVWWGPEEWPKNSAPWNPRTVEASRMHIPSWAFKR